MDKCSCYCVKKIKQSCVSQITGMPFWYDVEVSYCNGTKERDECLCGGDETKCDFYLEVRERAKKEPKGNSIKAYELLNKFKENLFATEFVSDEEASMLYHTILFWREHSEAYFDLLENN